MKLRVWWKPQIPCESFEMPVQNLDEAKLLLRTLAQYDIWQLEHRIKPDFCNAGGLETWGAGEWLEWEDEDGNSIDDVMKADREAQS